MYTALTLALLSLQVSLLNHQVQTLATIQAPVVVQTTQEEQAITDVFPDAPIMQKIAACESGKRQFDEKGKTITNGTGDYGIFEIRYTHIKEAKSLGMDIFTIQGNLAYARYLYDREGTRPWLSSVGCWASGSAADDGSRNGYSEMEEAQGEKV